MTIYLNGQYMPIEDAKIPVLDRGFIFRRTGDTCTDRRVPHRVNRGSQATA